MLCKFEHIEKCLKSQPPIKLIKSLTINEDFSWSVHVHGYRLNATTCSALCHVPEKIKTKATLNKLLLTLDKLNVCSGNPDAHFLALADSRNGVLQSQSNSTISFVDAFNSVSHNGKVFDRTVNVSFQLSILHATIASNIDAHCVLYIVSGFVNQSLKGANTLLCPVTQTIGI